MNIPSTPEDRLIDFKETAPLAGRHFRAVGAPFDCQRRIAAARQGAERAKALPFRSKGVFGAFEKQASLPPTLGFMRLGGNLFQERLH